MEKYKDKELLPICPVCGFDELFEPPYDSFGYPSHENCPCCGFEFGFDDSSKGFSFKEYRTQWIKSGFQWFSSERTTKTWNKELLNKQLLNIEKVNFYQPRFVMEKHKLKHKKD